MTRLRPVSLVLLCVLSSACDHDEPVFCTAEVVPSVRVEVVDGQGKPRDARVTFTLNGGPPQQALCQGKHPTQPDTCANWVAGQEAAGEIVVTAASPRSSSTASHQLLITRGECHVRTQELTLVLLD